MEPKWENQKYNDWKIDVDRPTTINPAEGNKQIGETGMDIDICQAVALSN